MKDRITPKCTVSAVALGLLASSITLHAQNTLPASGNVGVGTTSPSASLTVANGGNDSFRVGVNSNAANCTSQILNSLAVVGSNSSWESVNGAVAWNFYNNGVSPSWSGTLLSFCGSEMAGTRYGFPAANQGALIFQNTAVGVIGSNGMAPIYISPWGTPAAAFLANGNVGIGSVSPRQPLEVFRNSNPALNLHDGGTAEMTIGVNEGLVMGQFNTNSRGFRFVAGQDGLTFPGGGAELVRFAANGNVGVGTASPTAPLEVLATTATTNSAQPVLLASAHCSGLAADGFAGQLGFRLGDATYTDAYAGIVRVEKSGTTNGRIPGLMSFWTHDGTNWHEGIDIAPTGNVGIGTRTPTNKLEVNGTIRAKEVIVEATGWSDYVFAPDYRLASLSEVEAHIVANGHLPGVPSAAEVAAQGVSVGDMQAMLMAKVEELTLYVIKQQKTTDALVFEVAQLKAENAALRKNHP